MSFGLTKLLVLAAVGAILFGRGRFVPMMGNLGRGLRGFRKAVADQPAIPTTIDHESGEILSGKPVRRPMKTI
ncbi:sec-independent protein translocase protein TatA [Faunimonas pinastri]|uniref:Sec-independent protein translocase protein TatA n=1 Tax=Faunimonas pinastri TaxID=1855383 RepID=A0A1H9CSG6_9HYPH|nr:twin-arginine translocase TatA/TatE family subunit [Faunimonas pinastri]SEQ04115.1 sec-independent protein translocase protein TatA [Faunimonas pinastri]